ncbi:methyltransferase family protein [Algiphilus sp.]|uniref:methyltransferase family protein n=1 Tax=Algiphilus sp. TaxID=1872431 RepID=UPI003B516EAE
MKQLFALFAALVGLIGQAVLVLFLLDAPVVGVNQGGELSAPVAVAINLGLLFLFALPHSVMARPAFKQRWRALVPDALERSVYILMSGVLLTAVCVHWQPLPSVIWSVEGAALQGVIYALFAGGLGFLFWAILSIDFLHFHGLRQAFSAHSSEPPFAVHGPYRIVRHPIQTGLIVALWATPHLTVGQALFAAVLTGYSVLATLKLEERDLRAGIGDAYERYRSKVPALIPGPRIWRD